MDAVIVTCSVGATQKRDYWDRNRRSESGTVLLHIHLVDPLGYFSRNDASTFLRLLRQTVILDVQGGGKASIHGFNSVHFFFQTFLSLYAL